MTCLLCCAFQAQRDIIFELRRIAFDAESDPSTVPGSGTEKRKAMYTKDYKMLGFTVSTQSAPPRQEIGGPTASPGSPPITPIVVALGEQTERGEGLCAQFALAMDIQWAYIIWACKPDPLVTGPGSQPQRGEGTTCLE